MILYFMRVFNTISLLCHIVGLLNDIVAWLNNVLERLNHIVGLLNDIVAWLNNVLGWRNKIFERLNHIVGLLNDIIIPRAVMLYFDWFSAT